jgi:hypothetical protein
MAEKPPLLAPDIELEPVLADPEGVFRKRLGRTEVRTSIFAVIVIALGAFMLWLYVLDPGEDVPLSGVIALFAISGAFILFGLRLLWGAATSSRRHARLLRLLDERPDRVARIFAAVMRQRPGVHRQVIQPPEAENMPIAPGGYHIVIELKPRNRLERLLGSHKHAVIARARDIPALLAWLRAKAPNAAGPPPF